MIELDPRLLAQFVDLLMKAMAGLFQKNTIRSDCKKAGKNISVAIREILSLDPDVGRVRQLLTEAEKLCPGQAAEVARARELLAALEASGLKRKSLRSRKKTGSAVATEAKDPSHGPKAKVPSKPAKGVKR